MKSILIVIASVALATVGATGCCSASKSCGPKVCPMTKKVCPQDSSCCCASTAACTKKAPAQQ